MSTETKDINNTDDRRFSVIKPETGIELKDDMRLGLKRESFLLSKKQRPMVCAYSKKLDMKFKTRALSDSTEHIRVWRTA